MTFFSTSSSAQQFFDDGYNMLPIALDGKKRPAGLALPNGSWGPLQDNRITAEDVTRWYGGQSPYGIAVICGHISDNLLVLDCETKQVWDDIHRDLSCDPELAELVQQCTLSQTPSGGYHLWMHLDHPCPPGKKLAQTKTSPPNVLVETRGQGHYICAPGSPSAVHALNLPYEFVEYNDREHRCYWTSDQVDRILGIAASYNQYTPPEKVAPTPAAAPTGDHGTAPGSLFNAHASWTDILEPHGWKVVGHRGDSLLWCRPGKANGISATTGHCSTPGSGSLLYVFSTSAHPFEGDTAYSKFAACALLNHGGDFKSCASDLSAKGYKEDQGQPFHIILPSVTVTAPDGSTKVRRYKYSSELMSIDPDIQWFVHGLIKRGASTLLTAHPKVGKTTWLSHMLQCLGIGSTFCGLATKPIRVMVVSEEDESTLADRCKELGIGDHVSWYCRPFVTRPNPLQWKQFLGYVRQDCLDTGSQMVIIDTIAKCLPVRDENSASEIESALTPLWELTQQDIALLGVHHSRKSPGQDGTAARGSGALTGHFEILLDMLRGPEEQPTHRIIKGNSRYKQTPSELLVELTAEGYQCLGSPSDHAGQMFQIKIMNYVQGNPAMDVRTIAGAVELPRPLVQDHLDRMVVAGVLTTTGSGTRGDHKRYYIGR